MDLPFPLVFERVNEILWGSEGLPPQFQGCEGPDRFTLFYQGVATFVGVRLYAAVAGGVIGRRELYALVTRLSRLGDAMCNPSWNSMLEYDPESDSFLLTPSAYLNLFNPDPLDPDAAHSKAANPDYMVLASLLRDALELHLLPRAGLRLPRVVLSSAEIALATVVGLAMADRDPDNPVIKLVTGLLAIIAGRPRHRVDVGPEEIIEFLASLARRGSASAVDALAYIASRSSVTRTMSQRAVKALVQAWAEGDPPARGRAFEVLSHLAHTLPALEAKYIVESVVSRVSPEDLELSRGVWLLAPGVLEGDREAFSMLLDALEKGVPDAALIGELACIRSRMAGSRVPGSACSMILEGMLRAMTLPVMEAPGAPTFYYHAAMRRLLLSGFNAEIRSALRRGSLVERLLAGEAGVRFLLDYLTIMDDPEVEAQVCRRLEEAFQASTGEPRPSVYMYKKLYAIVKRRGRTPCKPCSEGGGRLCSEIEWADRVMGSRPGDEWLEERIREKEALARAGYQRGLWTLMDIAIISGESSIVERILDTLKHEAAMGDRYALLAIENIALSTLAHGGEGLEQALKAGVEAVWEALEAGPSDYYVETARDTLITLLLLSKGRERLERRILSLLLDTAGEHWKLYEALVHGFALLRARGTALDMEGPEAGLAEALIQLGQPRRGLRMLELYLGPREAGRVETAVEERLSPRPGSTSAALELLWYKVEKGENILETLARKWSPRTVQEIVKRAGRSALAPLLGAAARNIREREATRVLETLASLLDRLEEEAREELLATLASVSPLLVLQFAGKRPRYVTGRVRRGLAVGIVREGYNPAVLAWVLAGVGECRGGDRRVDELVKSALQGDLCALHAILQHPPLARYDGLPLLWLLQ